MNFRAHVRYDSGMSLSEKDVDFTETSRAAALKHVEWLQNVRHYTVERLERVIPIKIPRV